MKISTLKRARKTLDEITEIDKQLLYLRGVIKDIKDVTNDDICITLSSIQPPERKLDDCDENNNGYPIAGWTYPSVGSMMNALMNAAKPLPHNSKVSKPLCINEVCAMQIIGVIAAHLESSRMVLVNKLIAMGIKVEP